MSSTTKQQQTGSKRSARTEAPPLGEEEDLDNLDELGGREPGITTSTDAPAPAYRIKRNKQAKMAVRDTTTAAAVDAAASSGASLSKRLSMGACSAWSPQQQRQQRLSEEERMSMANPDELAAYLKEQQDAARERDLRERREYLLRGIVEKQQANARAARLGLPEPHALTVAELEFADPAAARTHHGEGEVAVSDKDLLDHHIHDDLKLGQGWQIPPVTGRGRLNFGSFGCRQRCAGCKSEDPDRPGSYLEVGGFDVQTVGEFYGADKRAKRARHPHWSDAEVHESAANQVKRLARTLLGEDVRAAAAPGSCMREAFAARVTCNNGLCLVAAGVMSAEDRKEWLESEQDSNQQNGNKRYGSNTLLRDNCILMRVLWEEEKLTREEVAALVMDMSMWTFWTEYRQREFIGTAVTIVRRCEDTRFPMPAGKRQEFLTRMAAVPENFINDVVLEHILSDKYHGDLNDARRNVPREEGTRSWTAVLDALFKQRFPDANTVVQFYLYYENWVSRGRPADPETGNPRHEIWEHVANRDIYGGPLALAEALAPYLDGEHDRKTKLVYAAAPAAGGSGAPSAHDYGLRNAIGAVSKGCGLNTASMRAEFERLITNHSHARKQTCDALVRRAIANGELRYAGACNTLFLPNNCEVWYRYVYAGRCWGVNRLEQEDDWCYTRLPKLFLARCRVGAKDVKGWEVVPPKQLLQDVTLLTRRAQLRHEKNQVDQPIYAAPMGTAQEQLEQALRETVQTRGRVTGLGMGVVDPTFDQLPDGARIFAASAEVQAATKVQSAARTLCHELQKLIVELTVDGEPQRRCGLPTMSSFHRSPSGRSWTDVKKHCADAQLLSRLRALGAAHTTWNRLAQQYGALDGSGEPRYGGCQIDALTLRAKELPKLALAARLMLRAHGEWKHEYFTHDPTASLGLDAAHAEHLVHDVRVRGVSREEGVQAIQAWSARRDRLLPGLCYVYSDNLVEALTRFVSGVDDLERKLPMCLARGVVRVQTRQDERAATGDPDPVGVARDAKATSHVRKNYDELVGLDAEGVARGVLDPKLWPYERYATLDHHHFFLNAHIQRNRQRLSWWTDFLQRPAADWRVDVEDEVEGADRSFAKFCELRGIHAATLFPTLDDVRASFAKQLLAVEEANLHRLRKIARKTKEGSKQRARAWLQFDVWCRRYELFTCKRVLRWLTGACPDNRHCVKLERKFEADLKARFAGGASRQLQRNRMMASGRITDSVFDGKARKAAEEAVGIDAARKRTSEREAAEAERQAEDARQFAATEGDGETSARRRGDEDAMAEARRVLRGAEAAAEDEEEEEAGEEEEEAEVEAPRAAASAPAPAPRTGELFEDFFLHASVEDLARLVGGEDDGYSTDYDPDEVWVNWRTANEQTATRTALLKRRTSSWLKPAAALAASSSTGGQIAEEAVELVPEVASREQIEAAIEAAQGDDRGPDEAAGRAARGMRRGGKDRMLEQLAQQSAQRVQQARKAGQRGKQRKCQGVVSREKAHKEMDKRLEAMRERTRAARMLPPQPQPQPQPQPAAAAAAPAADEDMDDIDEDDLFASSDDDADAWARREGDELE